MSWFYHVVSGMVTRLGSRRLHPGIVLLLGLAVTTTARAQLFDELRDASVAGTGTARGVTVLSRLRPDYDYPGVTIGAVTVRPEIAVSTGYDDNVLGTSTAHGSLLQQTVLNVAAATNWSRNGAYAALQATDYRFLDQPRQSYTDWNASVGGTYQIGRDTVALSYNHQNLNQTPRDLDTARLDSAIAYRIDTADLSYNVQINRLSLTPAVQVSVYDFDDGTVAGQAYAQGYRDRIVYTPRLTASYELAPLRNIVAVVRNASASYRSPEAGQAVRDYSDTTVLAGLDNQLAGPWRLRVLAGYETRSFRSSAFKTIQAPVAELSVIWTPSGLTTVTTTLSRRIADSADETTAGLTATTAKVSVDRELRPNVLLHGETGIDIDSFGQGGGQQTLYTVGSSATWLLNRHVRLGATYDFTGRKTEATGVFGASGSTGVSGQQAVGNYTENRLLVQLRLGL